MGSAPIHSRGLQRLYALLLRRNGCRLTSRCSGRPGGAARAAQLAGRLAGADSSSPAGRSGGRRAILRGARRPPLSGHPLGGDGAHMKRIGIAMALVLGLAIAVLGGAFVLIESGEVIVLRTAPGQGGEFLARLWVVDYEGAPWIGKMDPSDARWVRRLREQTTAQLVRDGISQCRKPVFVADPDTRRQLYSLFMQKYRVPLYGARTLGFIFGGNPDPAESAESAVLIRLDPCDHGGQ